MCTEGLPFFGGMLIVVMGDSLFGFVVLIAALQEMPFHRAPKEQGKKTNY